MIFTLGKGRKTILQLYLVFPVCASVWNLAIHHNRVCRWNRGVLGRVQKHEIPTDFVIMTISPSSCSSSSSSEWVQEVWGGGERCRHGRRLSKGPKVNIVPSRGKIIALSLIIVIVFNIFFIIVIIVIVFFIIQPRLIQFTPRPSLHLLDCQSSSVSYIDNKAEYARAHVTVLSNLIK